MQSSELRKALHDFFGNISATMIAAVKSVDKNKCTCTIENDSVEYFNVRLRPTVGNNNGIVLYPKIGATVLAVKIENSEQWAVVFATEYDSAEILIDSIVLNNGNFGGLVKIEELTRQLNAFVNSYNSHTHPFVGVPPTSPGTTSSILTQAQQFNKSDYENPKFKH